MPQSRDKANMLRKSLSSKEMYDPRFFHLRRTDNKMLSSCTSVRPPIASPRSCKPWLDRDLTVGKQIATDTPVTPHRIHRKDPVKSSMYTKKSPDHFIGRVIVTPLRVEEVQYTLDRQAGRGADQKSMDISAFPLRQWTSSTKNIVKPVF